MGDMLDQIKEAVAELRSKQRDQVRDGDLCVVMTEGDWARFREEFGLSSGGPDSDGYRSSIEGLPVYINNFAIEGRPLVLPQLRSFL